jgi:flagellar basal body-associated protein FliL
MNGPVYVREDADDRPRRRGRLLRVVVSLLVLVIIVALVLVLAFKGTSSKSAKKDVTVTACGADSGGGKPTASGTILNHSSKASNYVIQITFTDPQGNTVSEGVAAVKDVAADETATWNLTGPRDTNGAVKCEITDVSRTHLPGQ